MTTLTGWFKDMFRKKSEGCLACGDCCKEFSWHLKASERDIERWRQLGRDDLLSRVNRLGWIWVEPRTKKRLPVCPYLVRTTPEKAHCAIHDIKPDICRAYPTLAHDRCCIRGYSH